MATGESKPRLFVVCPSLDKRHGTERCVAEWISGLADEFEIHVYSQEVRDVDQRKITWHKIPRLPGPHLANYVWWFVANHIWRWRDGRFRGLRPHVVFSPGANCLDADVISVHIVFREYARRIADDLKLTTHSVALWPRLLHRKLYYGFIAHLERRLYQDPERILILIARKSDNDLARHYGRTKPSTVIYAGLDPQVFNPERRASLRDQARRDLAYTSERFVLLLIGNHWVNKGLPVLLQALEFNRELPVDLLVVGQEDPNEYRTLVQAKHLSERVQFRQPRADVEFYYAAADAYVGPSLEDAFAMPPAEAMACGLPVIVSSAAGVSEIITNRADGLVLDNPLDARSLASLIQEIYQDKSLREKLGAQAARTARKYTWESNVRDLRVILHQALRKKSRNGLETLPQESREVRTMRGQ